MAPKQPAEVRDLGTLVKLVEQDRVGVCWSVTSDAGPEWIGSYRELSFFVDSTPIAENALTRRLANILIEALSIQATSADHVISGEGDLRRRGNLIEVVYDWSSAIPYDWPSQAGSGIVTLIDIDIDIGSG